MADKAKEVSVRILTENHQHGGKAVKKGDVIKVSEGAAQFLISNKIGEAA
jgi:hypothetical protein